MYCWNFRKKIEEGKGFSRVTNYMKKKLFYKTIMLCMLLCCNCVVVGCSDRENENKNREELVKEISVEDLQSGVYNTDLLMLEDWDTMVSNGTVCVEDGGILSSFSCQYEDYILVIDDSVQEIGDDVFSSNNHLKEVVIPDSVTKIGAYAFVDCSVLEAVYGGNGVNEIGEVAFAYCTNLKKISIPKDISVINYSTFEACESLENISIPDSVTIIQESAFMCCEGAQSITIPDSVTMIYEQAFLGCSALTTLELPKDLNYIGEEAFLNVNNIAYSGEFKAIDNWGAKTLNGYVEGYAVYEDDTKKKLTGVSTMATEYDIPDSVEEVGAYAFIRCSKIKSVTVPNVKSIGENAFLYVNNIAYNGKLTSNDNWGAKTLNGYVDGDFIYENKTKKKLTGVSASTKGNLDISDGVVEIGSDAFYECESLETVTIPNSVKILKSGAFSECRQLKNIAIPNSVKKIEKAVFADCKSLETVVLPNRLEAIEAELFYNCQSLKNVEIPQSVKKIGKEAFYCCYDIENLVIPDTITEIGKDAFVYVPDSELTYNGDAVDNYEDSNGRWGAVSYREEK